MSRQCEVVVEKVYQSPSTPVYELAYLVQIRNPENAFDYPESVSDFEKQVMQYLEMKSRPNF